MIQDVSMLNLEASNGTSINCRNKDPVHSEAISLMTKAIKIVVKRMHHTTYLTSCGF